MSVRIDFIVSDEFNDQIEIVCSSKSTTKHKWITGLIREEISVFLKEHKEKEIIRKSWSIENGNSKPNLIEIGKSFTIPPAY